MTTQTPAKEETIVFRSIDEQQYWQNEVAKREYNPNGEAITVPLKDRIRDADTLIIARRERIPTGVALKYEDPSMNGNNW